MTEIRHWADVIAEDALNLHKNNIIATGITPSGHIHIGNMREVVTADAVYKALLKQAPDSETKFYYIADNYDPLRKVYPFLEESEYKEHVGKPLSEIPCPCGEHSSYSDHFLDPFLKSMNELGIHPEVLKIDELYKSGFFKDIIVLSLQKRDKIAQILHEASGRETDESWSPFNPVCEKCGKINSTIVNSFNADEYTVDYSCKCGYCGVASMIGGGKLTWRVEWPAKWALLGVTIEPFGKDHAASGGSYDTGIRIVREIFGKEPPIPVNYEWIMLGNKGAMSSSTGVVISIKDMLEVIPPEALRYLIIRTKPEKHIRFDPSVPLLNLVDEYERLRDKEDLTEYEKRIIDLSKSEGVEQSIIPFKQMVTIYQVARGDIDRIEKIANRSGFNESRKLTENLAENVKNWLERYAPPFAKFGVSDTIPVQAASLTDCQRAFLKSFADELLKHEEPSAEDVQKLIYETKDENSSIHKTMVEYFGKQINASAINPKDFFIAIYISLLGTPSGPKAGWFLTSFDVDFLVERFREAAEYKP